MTKLLLLFVLFSATSFSKQSFQEAQDKLLAQLSTTKERIQQESLEWDIGFYKFLIDDEDPNIRLIGYNKVLSRFRELKQHPDLIDIDLVDIATEFNYMLETQQLSHKSLATITSACNYKKLINYCNHSTLFDRQNQAMPDNAYIYINRLRMAIEDDNQEGIKQAIIDLSQSKYLDSFMYIHNGYREKLESYVNENPFSKKSLAMEALWINHFATHKMNEQKEKFINLEETQITIRLIREKQSAEFPHLKNIIDICKNSVEYEKPCLKISSLFITHSKALISSMVGHVINIEILKQQGNIEQVNIAKTSKATFEKHYNCLTKILSYKADKLSLPKIEFIKHAESIERNQGELAYMESLAKSNYAYYSELGDTGINNPENCK